jgi:hypothetical protein
MTSRTGGRWIAIISMAGRHTAPAADNLANDHPVGYPWRSDEGQMATMQDFAADGI